MTVSLKDVCSTVASVLHRPSATVYEHQRELARFGLLERSRGVGPGTGVRATPQAVATLVIAELVGSAEGWVGIGERTKAAMRLKDDTGTLVDALASVLAMDRVPKEIWLQISPGRSVAILSYSSNDDLVERHFAGTGKTPPGIVLDANLYRGLNEIAKALKG